MYLALNLLVVAITIVRVLLRPHRNATSRVAWVVVILALPYLGVIAYLLLGETNIGRKRVERIRQATAEIPGLSQIPGWDVKTLKAEIDPRHEPSFIVGESVSGYPVVGGNRAELMADSNAAIDSMVADIDAAVSHVHLLFYIWMPDNNGIKMAEALKRAVARGVTCRAMVDDMGSRLLIKSALWKDMQAAGVNLCRMLKVGNPLLRIFKGRIDLRCGHLIAKIAPNWLNACFLRCNAANMAVQRWARVGGKNRAL